MSAISGFFNMEVLDKDGKADAETAKKVFDYALEHSEWFVDKKTAQEEDGKDTTDYFELNENCISANELDLKYKFQNLDDYKCTADWLGEVAKNVSISKMNVYLRVDMSDSWGNDYISIWVVEGEKVSCLIRNEETIYLSSIGVEVFIDSDREFALLHNCGAMYKPVFKSRKTGKRYKLPLSIRVCPEDYDYFEDCLEDILAEDDRDYYLSIGGESGAAIDKDGKNTTCIKDIVGFKSMDLGEIFKDYYEDFDKDFADEKDENGEIDLSLFDYDGCEEEYDSN